MQRYQFIVFSAETKNFVRLPLKFRDRPRMGRHGIWKKANIAAIMISSDSDSYNFVAGKPPPALHDQHLLAENTFANSSQIDASFSSLVVSAPVLDQVRTQIPTEIPHESVDFDSILSSFRVALLPTFRVPCQETNTSRTISSVQSF